ncbi:MAG: chromosomal replication initiator protein DnaA [Acidobacteria bacterium]|nr:MAG: chromosomal replication initiator protein DnaA [Acidobacteriota bacterium]PYS64006.1 MAG: chromosomal replication initiator protein DnaA [Acidobacteriota bacterium]
MRIERDSPSSIAFVAALQRNLTKQAFETWFRPLTVTKQSSDGKLRISVPNTVAKEWILSNYSFALEQSLKEVSLGTDRIEWIVSASHQENSSLSGDCKTEPTNSNSRRAETSPEPPISLSALSSSSLNEKYTFGSFVVASCNRFAHAATQAVADGPGKTYNPLYIYGGVGLGKTHLIQATGHAIRAANPTLQVVYVSLERFMNELINAIRYGYDKTQLFREKYRSIDVLLIDDVQFIAGKERTQEEFFHTFNALYDAQKQIVLTSDCPPREIPEIEERLHSRFEWGLIADIEPPDLETKIAILKRKAEIQRVDLPDDVAFFLASNSKHNIRELEGSLVRVLAMASLRGLRVSKALAQEALRHVSKHNDDHAVSVPRIQKVVAEYYKVTVDNLRVRSNARHFLVPRQIAMYLCKRLTKASYPEIARQFGGKHHTTVIHSVEKIEGLIAKDSELGATVKRLIESISD